MRMRTGGSFCSEVMGEAMAVKVVDTDGNEGALAERLTLTLGVEGGVAAGVVVVEEEGVFFLAVRCFLGGGSEEVKASRDLFF